MRASSNSQSCPGEWWSLPHASEIVISFTPLVDAHKVEGKSDLPGKEKSPAFSLNYILVPEVISSRFCTSPVDFVIQWSAGSSNDPAPAFCMALRF